MPCRYDGPDDYSSTLRTELDKVTKMLCRLCEDVTIDDCEYLITSRKDLDAWWTAHKKADADRKAKERSAARLAKQQAELKKSALEKLTPEERKALGLK